MAAHTLAGTRRAVSLLLTALAAVRAEFYCGNDNGVASISLPAVTFAGDAYQAIWDNGLVNCEYHLNATRTDLRRRFPALVANASIQAALGELSCGVNYTDQENEPASTTASYLLTGGCESGIKTLLEAAYGSTAGGSSTPMFRCACAGTGGFHFARPGPVSGDPGALCDPEHYAPALVAVVRASMCQSVTAAMNENTPLACGGTGWVDPYGNCQNYTNCSLQAGSFEVARGSWDTSNGCQDATICGAGQYESQPPTYTTDRVCHTVAPNCTAGTFTKAMPTNSSDRICSHSNNTCNLATEFMTAPATATTVSACGIVNGCVGNFQETRATPTSDRVCNSTSPVGMCARMCVDGMCNYFASKQATPTTDVQCAACHNCDKRGQTVVAQCCNNPGIGFTGCDDTVCSIVAEAKVVSVGDKILLSLAGLVFVLAVAQWISFLQRRSAERKTRSLETQLGDQHELHERLLAQANEEIDDAKDTVDRMRQAWQVPEHHIQWHHKVAEGGYGTVFKGHWAGHSVAIKVLKFSLLEDPIQRQDFDRECETLMTIKHPNLLIFFGAGLNSEGKPFLVTEFMSGGSLKSLLADTGRPLLFARRVMITTQIAFGCAYLHKLKISHRDLKSDNVLIDNNLDAKVGDFGTAKFTSSRARSAPQIEFIAAPVTGFGFTDTIGSTDFSGTGAATATASETSFGSYESATMTRGVGTMLWMAPELFAAGSNKYGPEVDVWSFGIIMWELATRRVPWEDDIKAKTHLQFGAALRSALEQGRRPIIWPAEREQTTPEYTALMEDCTMLDPAARPAFTLVSQRLAEFTAVPAPM